MEGFSPTTVSFNLLDKLSCLIELGGKGLGGSSMINGFYYGRGTSTVYDLWEARGNPGWSWDDVYPLFIKVGLHLVLSKGGTNVAGHPF